MPDKNVYKLALVSLLPSRAEMLEGLVHSSVDSHFLLRIDLRRMATAIWALFAGRGTGVLVLFSFWVAVMGSFLTSSSLA